MRVRANVAGATPKFIAVDDLSLLRASSGFTPLQTVRWVDAHPDLSDLRWCYFGAQTNRPNNNSRGILFNVLFQSNGVQRQTRDAHQKR